MDRSLELLLGLVDEGFDRKSWHGTNLRGSIRGVSAHAATRRPGPNRHNIWELTVHAAYWKYAVRRRLTGEKRGTFAYAGSNWFERPVPAARRARGSTAGTSAERAWKSDVRLLVDQHRLLREAIAGFDPRRLFKPLGTERYSAAFLIRGIAAHDLYHAGQIQLLKKLKTEVRT